MKGSSKPISSPGRTEKFPPPLMRFLRSNVGNKSRGRTRNNSPMFMRKNKNNDSIEIIQEPSSPKVTCIGQVRVHRSSKSVAGRGNGSRRRKKEKEKQQQKCCCNFEWKMVKFNKPKSLISVLDKWVCCCFPFVYCGKRVETIDSNQRFTNNNIEVVEADNIGTKIPINPPKNALILTRCRSAPYRSSSLASRFWGSPLNHHSSDSSYTNNSQSPQKTFRQLKEEDEDVVQKHPLPPPLLETNPISPISEDGVLECRKSHETEEMQSTSNVHPLLLTRCKSEPATTGERLILTRFTEPDSSS